jgi:hypothetical protein
VKGLKVLKSVNAANGEKTWYYIEYRQPVGFDRTLTDDGGNLTQGVLIHTGVVTTSNFATSLLLDMTPNSNAVGAYDVLDGALGIGRSYSDATSGISISLVSADAAGAVVDVTVGSAQAPACTRAAPSLALAGPTTAVPAGTAGSYTLTMTNRDSGSCAATSFALARSVPAGWTGVLGSNSLSLSAGASGSTTLTVTSPTGVAAGSYAIGAGASSTVGSVHTANASGTYQVAAPSASSLSETVATDKAAYVRGETVAMQAKVLKSGVAVNGATVRFVVVLPGGSSTTLTATTGSDGVARAGYKSGKGKAAVGNYQLRADASSGGATATATTTFSVR